MRTYRMSVPASLNFDVRAENEEHALQIAEGIVKRIWEEGADIPDCDPEEDLANATCYPAPHQELPEIIDEGEDDLEPGPTLLKAAAEGEARARELYGKGAEACEHCHGLRWLHIDDAGGNGPEVECCQGCGAVDSGEMPVDDAEAVRRHRIQCGCDWPENAMGKEEFYQGRTKMPSPTFSPAVDEDAPTGMQEGVTR